MKLNNFLYRKYVFRLIFFRKKTKAKKNGQKVKNNSDIQQQKNMKKFTINGRIIIQIWTFFLRLSLEVFIVCQR